MPDNAYTQAINKALSSAKSMLGKNEVPNRTEIMQYLHDGGQDLDPHKLAWCAAFVSASLQKAGLPVPTQIVQGSAFGPGAYAPNYRTYGSAVDPKDIQAGDILVNNAGNHVGFAEGPTRMGANGLEAKFIAGNEKDTSGQYQPGSYTNPATGAVANRSQVGQVGENWVPLSTYSARRYIPPSSQPNVAAPTSGGTPLYIGDSRAVGMSLAGPKGESTGIVGQGPDKVLGQISGYKGNLGGRDIYLSPGTANVMKNGQWDKAGFDATLPNIQAQFAALKNGGADMSRVHVLGVPNDYGGDYANSAVNKIASGFGSQFHTLDSQDLHPGSSAYKSVFASSAQPPTPITINSVPPSATTSTGGASMTPAERDLMIRTIAGEAGGESPTGQAGVAHVIMNRVHSGGYGDGINGVIMKPGQFSNWNGQTGYAGGKGGNSVGHNLTPDSATYTNIGKIVDGVNDGSIRDPTNGATHYYNPKAASPSWGDDLAKTNDVTIGNHRFVGASTGPGQDSQPLAVNQNAQVNSPAANIGTTITSTPASTTAPSKDPPSPASLIAKGDWGGALGAIGNNPDMMKSIGDLGKTAGGANQQQAQAPPPMPIPKLDTNQGQIAQMAPQLMAQVMAGQPHQIPIQLYGQQRRPQIPGLSLGGFGYG